MPLYFLLLDAGSFRGATAPALAAAWRRGSFAPCRGLCAGLVPAARAFAERYHLGADEPLLARVAREGGGVPFDRDLWRLLVGEVLLYAAAEIPEFQTAPATLACLLAPAEFRRWPLPRMEFAPIQQAHHGSRDLVLGGFYRPEHAGWNDAADVSRMADYLGGIDPGRWAEADLAALPEVAEEDRGEELAFARDCLASLRETYARARERGQVIVCETL
jgi:hypothetical protein